MYKRQGKGNAFVRTKMRSLTSGKVLDNTFNSGASITPVRVERQKFQFLYKDEVGYNFMNTETFEQILLDEKIVTGADLMKDCLLYTSALCLSGRTAGF